MSLPLADAPIAGALLPSTAAIQTVKSCWSTVKCSCRQFWLHLNISWLSSNRIEVEKKKRLISTFLISCTIWIWDQGRIRIYKEQKTIEQEENSVVLLYWNSVVWLLTAGINDMMQCCNTYSIQSFCEACLIVFNYGERMRFNTFCVVIVIICICTLEGVLAFKSTDLVSAGCIYWLGCHTCFIYLNTAWFHLELGHCLKTLLIYKRLCIAIIEVPLDWFHADLLWACMGCAKSKEIGDINLSHHCNAILCSIPGVIAQPW